MKISAVVLAKNEENNIKDCLDNLDFCDEIIVIDDDSTDRTYELLEQIAKENNKIKVFKRSLEDNFSAQREFGISKTSNDWVFFVDSDERISSELANEIIESLSLPDFTAYLIPRVDFMWGNRLSHGDLASAKFLRLFDKNKGSLKGKVHEVWETKKEVGQLVNSIQHYPHPTISEFLKEVNFYSTLRAQELYEKKKKVNFVSLILYPKGKFLVNYFIRLGFLDGTPGLVHALIMSFYSFLVRGKLWLLWQQK